MKYRFRRIKKKSLPERACQPRLRLAGRKTLRAVGRLPEPIEAIRMEIKPPKASGAWRSVSHAVLWLYKKIYSVICEIIYELSVAARRLLDLCKRGGGSVWCKIKERQLKKSPKRLDSLPVLLGGAVSSLLVCLLTVAILLASFFMPYSGAYDSVTIPSLQGKSIDKLELDGSRFNLVVEYENNPDVEDGRVISQIPAAGVTRRLYGKASYCTIHLTVSKHTPVTVPEGLVGNSLRDATLSLRNSALTFTVSEKASESKSGTVISCYPAEGESIAEGGRVTLTVSAGKNEKALSVPSLSGLSESEAIFRIQAAGLSVGEVRYLRSDKKVGVVLSQSPSPYTTVEKGTKISFTVSAGAEFFLPTVPDLYGMSIEEATEALRGVGLALSRVNTTSSAAKSGTVIAQTPAAGTPITSSINSVELHISN